MPKEEYLGDGLYASFDGFMFKLRAPRMDGDHAVFLEPAVLRNFDGYRKRVIEEMENERNRKDTK
jgi:hypothetical protein